MKAAARSLAWVVTWWAVAGLATAWGQESPAGEEPAGTGRARNGAVGSAVDLGAAQAEMESRLERARTAYGETLRKIAAEKVPLALELQELEAANQELRGRVEVLQGEAGKGSQLVTAAQSQLEGLQNQTVFLERILEEYLVNFESRLHPAEDQLFKAELTATRDLLTQPGATGAERLAAYFGALELGAGRQETLLGGYLTPGRAVGTGGAVRKGTMAVLGPAAYFQEENGGEGGLLVFHPGTIEPGLAVLDGVNGTYVGSYVASGRGDLPLDASLGDALALAETQLDLRSHVEKGGPVGYTILTIGAIALLISLVKMGDFQGFRLPEPKLVQTLAQEARDQPGEGVLEKARAQKGLAGQLFVAGVENVQTDPALLEDLLLSIILRQRVRMERFLPFLAITAAAAPLLGLLGTVVGMIETFAYITVFGSGDPKALSSGISVALVTTELGLMVAIPALLVHALYQRLIKSRVGQLEQMAFQFVRIVKTREEGRPKG